MASAWFYDLFMSPLERLGLARLRRRVVADLGGRILELGTGTGLLFAAYENPPAVAVDIDASGFVRARRRNPRVALVQADAQALPFKDAAFDAVVETLSLCSIPDPLVALGEASRVLKRDGELRLLEHVRPPGPVLARLFDWLAPAWLRLSGGCHLDRRTGVLVGPAGFTITSARESASGIVTEIRARKNGAAG
jgi:ubiquinone/menaquinone biosynthesis C-methylase UbiE